MPRTLTWAREEVNTLIFPAAMAEGQWACFTWVTTGRNFSIPIPNSNHKDEAGLDSSPPKDTKN